jgi:hypothetical protein
LGEFQVISPTYDWGGGQWRYAEGVASIEVNNQAIVPVILLLRGKVSRVMSVAAGTTGTVRVFPGTYQIGFQIGTTRFYGEKLLKDQTYGVSFAPAPGNAPGAVSGATDIRGEIDAIARSGQYSPLPNAQMGPTRNTGASTATRILQNNTVYALHVLMSGPIDRRVELPPGGSTRIAVPPGVYRTAARVDSNTVLPFYVFQTLEAGIDYTSQFYVK